MVAFVSNPLSPFLLFASPGKTLGSFGFDSNRNNISTVEFEGDIGYQKGKLVCNCGTATDHGSKLENAINFMIDRVIRAIYARLYNKQKRQIGVAKG